jgi:hypothetical protein
MSHEITYSTTTEASPRAIALPKHAAINIRAYCLLH